MRGSEGRRDGKNERNMKGGIDGVRVQIRRKE